MAQLITWRNFSLFAGGCQVSHLPDLCNEVVTKQVQLVTRKARNFHGHVDMLYFWLKNKCLQCWGCLASGKKVAPCIFVIFFSCLKYRFSFCPIAAVYSQCSINCLKVGSHFLFWNTCRDCFGSAWNSSFGWVMSQFIGRAEIKGTSTQNFYQFN